MLLARADVVGSLLRPQALVVARQRAQAAPADFARIEDEAVDQAIALQQACGLDVVTDGELRRSSFQDWLTEAVEGLEDVPLQAYLWGRWRSSGLGDWTVPRPASLGVRSRLRRIRHPVVDEFVYLRARTSRQPKVALTSPSLYANLWSPTLSREAYPTLDGFLSDVADIVKTEIDELERAGATYIQLDAPHYPLLLEAGTRAFYESRGWNLDDWLARGIELDNAVMGDRPGVTFGLHLCRGNQRSRWLTSGGYEPLAPYVFPRTRAQRLLLEYDDERSGSFEPLRHVPDDKLVVLGLVSTKSGRLERQTAVEARIRQATAYVDLERLAVSPQCGFASSVLGNELTADDQRRKLELVAQTARAVWG